jgi:hypothetical protein
MELHNNARITPSGRMLLVRRILEGMSVTGAAEAALGPWSTGARGPIGYLARPTRIGSRKSCFCVGGRNTVPRLQLAWG